MVHEYDRELPERLFPRPLRVLHVLAYVLESILLFLFGFSNVVIKGNVGLAVAGFLYSALGVSTTLTLRRAASYCLHRGLMTGIDANLALQLASAGSWAGNGPAKILPSIHIFVWSITGLPVFLGAIHQFGFLLSESSYSASTTSGGLGYTLSGDSITPQLNIASSPADLGRAETLLGAGSIAFIRPWEEWQPGRTNVTTLYVDVPAFLTNMSFNDDLAQKEGWNTTCTGSEAWKSLPEGPFVYIYVMLRIGVWTGNCTITGCSGQLLDVDGDQATALPYTDYAGNPAVTFGAIDGTPLDYNIAKGSIWQYVCQQLYDHLPQQSGPGLALYARSFSFLDIGDSARMELAKALHEPLQRSYLTEHGLYELGVGTQPHPIQDLQEAKTSWVVTVVARVQFARWLSILTIIWLIVMVGIEVFLSLRAFLEGVEEIGVPAMIGMTGLDEVSGSCFGQPKAGVKIKVAYVGTGPERYQRFVIVGSETVSQAQDISGERSMLSRL